MLDTWFALLLLGAFLIIVAALIGGGMKDMNGWVWALFIAGIAFIVLSIIFGIVAWNNPNSCSYQTPVTVVSSPLPSTKLGNSTYTQIGTPTRVSTNVPQTKRGFATTNLDISSLAP